MRKQLSLAALAVVGALACSCIREKNFERYEPEPNAISFVLGSISTRTEADPEVQVNRYSLGTDDDGHLFTLEETVTWLDDIGDSPATRGTPAYTENLQDVHGSAFNARAYNATSVEPVIGDGAFYAMEDGVRWRRAFDSDPWPESGNLTFFINMPVEAPGLNVTGYNKTNGTISFTYQTPETAAQQQDILFAKATLNKDTYMSAYQTNGGASILLRHALTGIKFAIGNNTTEAGERNPEGEVQTFITKVEFVGLASTGNAVYDQDDNDNPGESASTGDMANIHSSKTSFTWTNLANYNTVFSQEYTTENIIDYEYDPENPDQVGAPESFYQTPNGTPAGSLRNLNDAKASLTFWFIPQQMTADVKVRVTFYVWDGETEGEEVTRELNLGQAILNQQTTSTLNLNWQAGQIRTFTLTPTNIDVDITAEVDDENANMLDTPVIRNTGNKEAYLRVAIVGNWVDSDSGEMVLGYDKEVVDSGTGDISYVYAAITPWDETNTAFGTFSPVLTPNSGNWRKKSDGYWYYTEKVPAGMKPGETALGGAYEPLFESYTKAAPPITVSNAVVVPEGVELMLDLAVQAIDAKAGNTYEAAWTAVGVL